MKKISVLYFLIAFSFSGLAAAESKLVSPYHLTAGLSHACVSSGDYLSCWGDTEKEYDLKLKKIISVSAGAGHVCAVGAGGLECRGDNSYGQAFAPALRGLIAVAAGEKHTCALGADGVYCWGDNERGQTDLPKLENPWAISAGGRQNCAIDNSGVKCWGDSLGTIPALNNPFAISLGNSAACAVDLSGVKCWGGGPAVIPVPPLKGARAVSVGASHVCALDSDGVKCWGGNDYGQSTVPVLSHPRAISVAGNYSCAIDDSRIKCWGQKQKFSSAYMKFQFASLYDAHFSLNDFPGFLRVAAEVSSASRSKLFLGIAAFLDVRVPEAMISRKHSEARYLAASLVSQAVLSSDSTFAREKIIPGFSESMRDFEKELGSSGINSIPASRINNLVVLTVAQHSLKLAVEFSNLEDQQLLQAALRALGQAIADPTDTARTENFLRELEASAAAWKKLESNVKSNFLTSTIIAAASWLKGAQQ